MEHADVVELIELAAVEPRGLERLFAGDTPEAAAVAGHLAGCPACANELERTGRAAASARQVIRELPDPALRERTLSYVRQLGRDRSGSAAVTPTRPVEPGPVATAEPSAPAPEPAALPEPASAPSSSARIIPLASRRDRRLGWFAAAVAAVLVAAIAGFAAGGAMRPAAPIDDNNGIAMSAAQAAMHIVAQPDAVRIELAATGGSAGTGSLVYSAAAGELAMTVTGLAEAPDGSTYACWVELGGQRRRIGVLYMDGSDGTWAGPVSGLAGLANATFGVSLVPAGSSTGTPVLLGSS